jgi:hypothetical protein
VLTGDDYWYRQFTEVNDARWALLEATCLAIGAAGYFLSDDCRDTPTQRVTHLREVITDLREALGLPPETTPHPTTSTDGDTR